MKERLPSLPPRERSKVNARIGALLPENWSTDWGESLPWLTFRRREVHAAVEAHETEIAQVEKKQDRLPARHFGLRGTGHKRASCPPPTGLLLNFRPRSEPDMGRGKRRSEPIQGVNRTLGESATAPRTAGHP